MARERPREKQKEVTAEGDRDRWSKLTTNQWVASSRVSLPGCVPVPEFAAHLSLTTYI